MNEPKILIQQQIFEETQSTNDPEFQKLTKLQTNPKFKIALNFQRSSITNEPQILKEPQIPKETQIMNVSQILKDDQITNETQITNKCQISK